MESKGQKLKSMALNLATMKSDNSDDKNCQPESSHLHARCESETKSSSSSTTSKHAAASTDEPCSASSLGERSVTSSDPATTTDHAEARSTPPELTLRAAVLADLRNPGRSIWSSSGWSENYPFYCQIHYNRVLLPEEIEDLLAVEAAEDEAAHIHAMLPRLHAQAEEISRLRRYNGYLEMMYEDIVATNHKLFLENERLRGDNDGLREMVSGRYPSWSGRHTAADLYGVQEPRLGRTPDTIYHGFSSRENTNNYTNPPTTPIPIRHRRPEAVPVDLPDGHINVEGLTHLEISERKDRYPTYYMTQPTSNDSNDKEDDEPDNEPEGHDLSDDDEYEVDKHRAYESEELGVTVENGAGN